MSYLFCTQRYISDNHALIPLRKIIYIYFTITIGISHILTIEINNVGLYKHAPYKNLIRQQI